MKEFVEAIGVKECYFEIKHTFFYNLIETVLWISAY
ncbi:hypothetical protein KLPMMM146B3_24340 [Klebsiella pneumoniae]